MKRRRPALARKVSVQLVLPNVYRITMCGNAKVCFLMPNKCIAVFLELCTDCVTFCNQ